MLIVSFTPLYPMYPLYLSFPQAMLIVSFAAWVINRATTHLVNPPDFKIWSLIQLTVPPAVAGTPSSYYYPPLLLPPLITN